MLDRIMPLDELRVRMMGQNLSEIARGAGLNVRTLYRLRDNKHLTSVETRLKLTEYFLKPKS